MVTRTRTRPASRRLVPARVAFALLMAVLAVEALIVASFARSLPPAGGDGRTVLAVVAALIGLVVWWRSERPEGGERR